MYGELLLRPAETAGALVLPGVEEDAVLTGALELAPLEVPRRRVRYHRAPEYRLLQVACASSFLVDTWVKWRFSQTETALQNLLQDVDRRNRLA